MDLLRERAKHNLSQEKLAELSGVSRPTISAIEQGSEKAKPLTLEKIKLALENLER